MRLVSEVSRQAGKAAVAAATAASTSSGGQGDRAGHLAGGGVVTGAVRSPAPSRRAPSIQCGMDVGMAASQGIRGWFVGDRGHRGQVGCSDEVRGLPISSERMPQPAM